MNRSTSSNSSASEDSDYESDQESELRSQLSQNARHSLQNQGYVTEFLKYFRLVDVTTDEVRFPEYDEAKLILKKFYDDICPLTESQPEELQANIMVYFNLVPHGVENASETNVRLSTSFLENLGPVISDLTNAAHFGNERLQPGTSSLADIHYAFSYKKKQLFILYEILKAYSDFHVNGHRYFKYELLVLVDKIRSIMDKCHMVLYSIYSIKSNDNDRKVTAPVIEWNLTQSMRKMTDDQFLLRKLCRKMYPFKLEKHSEMLYKEKKVYKHVADKCKIPVGEFEESMKDEGALVELENGTKCYGKFLSNTEVFIYKTNPKDRDLEGYTFTFEGRFLLPVYCDLVEGCEIWFEGNEVPLCIDDETLDEFEDCKLSNFTSRGRVCKIRYPDFSTVSLMEISGVFVHSYVCSHSNCNLTMVQHQRLAKYSDPKKRGDHVFQIKTVVDNKIEYHTNYYEEYMDLSDWIAEECDRQKDIAAHMVYTRNASVPENLRKQIKKMSVTDVRPRNRQRELWAFLNGILYRGDLNIRDSYSPIVCPKFYPFECICGDENRCTCGSTRCLPKSYNEQYKMKMESDCNNFFDVYFPEEMCNRNMLEGPKNRGHSLVKCCNSKFSLHTEPNLTGSFLDLESSLKCTFCGRKYVYGENLETCAGNSRGQYPFDGYCETHKMCVSAFTQFKTPFLDSIFEYQEMTEEDIMWMKALLGRMLYPLNTDSWEIVTWLIGVAQTGKSLLTKIIQAIFPTDMVGIISNNTQGNFGLAKNINKFVLVGAELGTEFAKNMDSCVLQQMCSSEMTEFNVKLKEALVARWKLPLWFSGNLMPNVMDNSGSIFRRLVTADFHRKVTTEDALLMDRIIQSELPQILVSCSGIYMMLANKHRRSRPPLTRRFEDARVQLMGVCSPFERFIKSDEGLVQAPYAYIRTKELHRRYRRFVQENNIYGAPDVTQHTTTRGVIGDDKDIQLVNEPKLWPPISTEDNVSEMDAKGFDYYQGIGLYEHFPAEPVFNGDVFFRQLQLLKECNECNWEEILEQYKRRNLKITHVSIKNVTEELLGASPPFADSNTVQDPSFTLYTLETNVGLLVVTWLTIMSFELIIVSVPSSTSIVSEFPDVKVPFSVIEQRFEVIVIPEVLSTE